MGPETTIVTKTTVPFEQTTVEGINQTQGQQQSEQDNQTATQQGQSGQQQGNQSFGPLEQLGEAITAPFQ